MTDTQTEFAIDAELLRRVDGWREMQEAAFSREEAISELVKAGLRGQDGLDLSRGERLILSVLCDVSRKVATEGMIDPSFLQTAIQGGHSWAIEWEYPSLSHDHTNSRHTADFVVRVLSMWRAIEEGFARLSDAEKERVLLAGGLVAPPEFPGWNGEVEANLKSTARFMTDQMNLFPKFAGRAALDTGKPVLARYKRMLECLDGLPRSGPDLTLGADELATLLMVE